MGKPKNTTLVCWSQTGGKQQDSDVAESLNISHCSDVHMDKGKMILNMPEFLFS